MSPKNPELPDALLQRPRSVGSCRPLPGTAKRVESFASPRKQTIAFLSTRDGARPSLFSHFRSLSSLERLSPITSYHLPVTILSCIFLSAWDITTPPNIMPETQSFAGASQLPWDRRTQTILSVLGRSRVNFCNFVEGV